MDTEEIKDTLLGESRQICEKIKKDKHVLAVILSGPLALGKVSEYDKLYFAVITDKDDGAIEHHFLESYAGVNRNMEIGIFPLRVVEYMLKNGYADMPSYKALEAFRCGNVMYEKDGIGTKIIKESEKWIPEKLFIGDLVHATKANIDDAVALLENKEYKNAVLVARKAVDEANKLLYVARTNKKMDNESLNELTRLYKKVQGIENADGRYAEEKLDLTIDFVKDILKEIGVNPNYITE